MKQIKDKNKNQNTHSDFLNKEEIIHLRKCEYHNPNHCKDCNKIYKKFLQVEDPELHGFNGFKYALKENNIEQKYNDKIKDFEFYVKAFNGLINKLKKNKNMFNGKSYYDISYDDKDEFDSIAIMAMATIFYRLKKRNSNVSDYYIYTSVILYQEIKKQWYKFIGDKGKYTLYSGDTLIDMIDSDPFVEKNGVYRTSNSEFAIKNNKAGDGKATRYISSDNKNLKYLDLSGFNGMKNRFITDYVSADSLLDKIKDDAKYIFSETEYNIFNLFFFKNKEVSEISEILNIGKRKIISIQNSIIECLKHFYGKVEKNSINKYFGVYHLKKDNLWKAKIIINKKSTYIGVFKSKKQAALAYDKKARELGLKEVNFPINKDESFKKKSPTINVLKALKQFKKNRNISPIDLFVNLGYDKSYAYHSKGKAEVFLNYFDKVL